jgi:hypothetical protein
MLDSSSHTFTFCNLLRHHCQCYTCLHWPFGYFQSVTPPLPIFHLSSKTLLHLYQCYIPPLPIFQLHLSPSDASPLPILHSSSHSTSTLPIYYSTPANVSLLLRTPVTFSSLFTLPSPLPILQSTITHLTLLFTLPQLVQSYILPISQSIDCIIFIYNIVSFCCLNTLSYSVKMYKNDYSLFTSSLLIISSTPPLPVFHSSWNIASPLTMLHSITVVLSLLFIFHFAFANLILHNCHFTYHCPYFTPLKALFHFCHRYIVPPGIVVSSLYFS